MKKSTALFLIFLCLSFNVFKIAPLAANNTYKEGFYKLSDLNIQPDKEYDIQNISQNGGVYVLVFNENHVVQQSLRLDPKSEKYKLSPLKNDYTIVIVGNGEISIS